MGINADSSRLEIVLVWGLNSQAKVESLNPTNLQSDSLPAPPLQILDSQDFEEFPTKPLDAVQTPDPPLISSSQGQLAPNPSGLDSLGRGMEMELALGTRVVPGPAMGSGLGLALRVAAGSSLGSGLDFGSGAGAGPAAAAAGVASLDLETQRRLSLQEPQTPLDSRTPQRHSSDPGAS